MRNFIFWIERHRNARKDRRVCEKSNAAIIGQNRLYIKFDQLIPQSRIDTADDIGILSARQIVLMNQILVRQRPDRSLNFKVISEVVKIEQTFEDSRFAPPLIVLDVFPVHALLPQTGATI